MTFVYELDLYFPEVHWSLDVQICTSCVKAFESYRLTDTYSYRQIDKTDRQTRPKLYTTPLRGPVVNHNNYVFVLDAAD